MLKLIRFAMNNRPKLFEEFYEPHLSLQNDHTRNTRFNLLPVRLDVEWKFTIYQRIKCFNVASAQLCMPISDYAFMYYKRIVLHSYER